MLRVSAETKKGLTLIAQGMAVSSCRKGLRTRPKHAMEGIKEARSCKGNSYKRSREDPHTKDLTIGELFLTILPSKRKRR